MKTIDIHVGRATVYGKEKYVASNVDVEKVYSVMGRLNRLWSNKKVSVEKAQMFEVGDKIVANQSIAEENDDGISHIIGHIEIRGTISAVDEYHCWLETDKGRTVCLPLYAINGHASVLSKIAFT